MRFGLWGILPFSRRAGGRLPSAKQSFLVDRRNLAMKLVSCSSHPVRLALRLRQWIVLRSTPFHERLKFAHITALLWGIPAWSGQHCCNAIFCRAQPTTEQFWAMTDENAEDGLSKRKCWRLLWGLSSKIVVTAKKFFAPEHGGAGSPLVSTSGGARRNHPRWKGDCQKLWNKNPFYPELRRS